MTDSPDTVISGRGLTKRYDALLAVDNLTLEIRAGTCFGLLVMASEEAHRFYPELGTLYLERIGEMAAAALLRVAA